MRGILRAFSSDVLDLPWFRDPQFWSGYLDELAEQRINRVQLAFGMQYNYSHDPDVRDNYLCFAYPFLVEVPGWEQVRVARVDAAERALNLDALRLASDEAARRGIHFQLGLWNHAVAPEPEGSPNLRYPISGLPDEQIAEYSARALRVLLATCPGIAGVTFRVHYEGGVPERQHGAFWRTVMSGLAGTGRRLDVDLHAKGVDAELLEAARASRAHIIISGKYWAEHQGLPYHQASVRPLEKARPTDGDGLRGVTQNARRFTRYGYGDFLGEERGMVEGTDRTHTFIVDPIDGTTNFLHAIPHFAINIALERDGQVVAAVTHNPIAQETFWAEKGKGAYLNDKRLRVAARREMLDALLATGIPFAGRPGHAQFLKELHQISAKVSGVRRFGSAALSLAYVAAGWLNGFFEDGLSIHDYGASVLVIREAGGIVTDFAGGPITNPGAILGAAPGLHRWLVEGFR